MSAFDPDEVEDDLPERVIVVREPVSSAPGELEALAAEVAAVEDPSPPAPAIDLDEVDLRAEHAPLEADQAWLDALATDDDGETSEADEEATEAIELEADPEQLEALAAEVASEQLEVDLEQDRQLLDALATELAARRTPSTASTSELSPSEGAQLRTERWPDDETGPGTLRPKVPEPVIAARTIAPPSRSRRMLRRLRALMALVIVVVLAGVGLAGAIGAAVLLVVLALSRAFGSGP